jgi:UDP-N-acetylglucosamine--N-acetylmuramyl-(pentapeptide) pyrophosphoryl-undecaprenol N-acetylglucosamine transferase
MSIVVMGKQPRAHFVGCCAARDFGVAKRNTAQHSRYQARRRPNARVAQYYADEGIPMFKPFNDVPTRMSEAQLELSMATGAFTTADLSIIGRPSILVPLAHAVRDEQQRMPNNWLRRTCCPKPSFRLRECMCE